LVMAPSFQDQEPPENPVRFTPGKWRAFSVREEVSDARPEDALHP
jgi:hypothetical protein